MTDWNTTLQSPEFAALSEFLAETDVESIRQTALAEYGVDIRGVYCLSTGRMVGTFDEDVIRFAIDEEPSDSEEEIIDGLIVRVIASMRPSPMLNKPDRVTLINLAAKHPVDVFCYLANRLASNRYLSTHRVEALDPYLQRIAMHRQWSELALKGVDLRPWIHWLLELDSKRNLHDITPPQIELDRLNKWIHTHTGTYLLQLVTPENAATLLEVFEKWAFQRLGEYDERDKRLMSEANAIMRGNSMSQQAYVRSWLENPEIAGRKHLAKLSKKKKAESKPAKPKTEKQRKNDERLNQMFNLLDQVLEGSLEIPTPAKPAPKAFTAGDFLKKKES